MESPHEYQQGRWLFCVILGCGGLTGGARSAVGPYHHQCRESAVLGTWSWGLELSDMAQEKLNEAVAVLNKTLHVGPTAGRIGRPWLLTIAPPGNQHAEHEHRARRADVQELPVERALPS